MPEVIASTTSTTAPPDDPVHAAMADATVLRGLAAAARAMIRGKQVDVEEIVQEACKRALANRDKYDPGVRLAQVWLGGFVRNVAREKLRDLGVVQLPDDGRWEKLVAPGHEDELILAEMRVLVERFLSTLPAKLRQAVELRYLQGMEYEHIGPALGISPQNARQRVCRGITQLAALAKKEDRS